MFVGVFSRQHDMKGPENRSCEYEEITFGEMEIAANWQEIHADQSQQRPDPEVEARFVPGKEPDYRNQDDVKSGNEPGVASRCVYDADLLQGGSAEEEKSKDKAAKDGIFIPLYTLDFIFSEPSEVDPADNDECQSSNTEPEGIEQEGADMVHAHALGNEGEAPDDGSQK